MTQLDMHTSNSIPQELYLYGEPTIQVTHDFSTMELRFEPLDWRNATDEVSIIKLFPKQPTMDDLLDLQLMSAKLRSNRLDQFVRNLQTQLC